MPPKDSTLQQSNPQNVQSDQPDMMLFEIFPDFEDEDLVKVITQIESENSNLQDSDDKQSHDEVVLQTGKGQKEQKTINYSSNVANIANVNRAPLLPTMYFPHSNVTINYNISK